MVGGLGLAQLVSWGTLIYSIAVLGGPMATELGVSETAVFGAFSFSLVITGLVAPRSGKLIDRVGGRLVLTLGSVCGAVSLAAVALAPGLVTFVLAWGLAGVARAMTLYEAAFATLNQHTGASFRKSVTAITLIGGLAGTAFFPLSLAGLDHFGWRGTMLAFAAAQLLVCLPLYYACIPAGRRPSTAPAGDPGTGRAASIRRVPAMAFRALAASFALTAFITSAMSVHVINLLASTGLTIASAVMVASLIGPMQVAGRVVEFALGQRTSSRLIGAATLVLLVISVLSLTLVNARVAVAIFFAVTYGCANGVQTIVRGTVPAEMFGHEGYGHLIGRLAFPSFIARALAPIGLTFAGGAVFGMELSFLVLAGVALLALAAYVVAMASASVNLTSRGSRHD
jgi:MFS family permease